MPDWNPGDTLGFNKEQADDLLAHNVEQLFDLQYRLYASKTHALLVVFQAMDAGGKDGAVRHVMTGLNPQGCNVASFKTPTWIEREHDFLWRIHQNVPPLGNVGIFNRSHYEDVLVVRVKGLAAHDVWQGRYAQINHFEKMLSENGTVIVKFYLNIDKDEQKKRFQERIRDPQRNWKLSPDDFSERKRWDDYMRAYEDALTRCSTKVTPWYIIPSNHKWVRNLAISSILVETLEDLNLKFPQPAFDLSTIPADF
jgi:PPK2 family polyphosphate:nucleotide phosphotransferase